MSQPDQNWWSSAVIYQIYLRSFQDNDGDGVGDLEGIVNRLDYLGWLGVDAIWITPFYPSPLVDFGYDVTDYCNVDPRYGSLETFDRLVAQAHRRGLRVILDYVPNHTSDRHPWFVESRSSREAPKRNWYVWADAPADGRPVNNWHDSTDGSAWTWDETTSQFYYHRHLTEQPDLNWRNPDVAREMTDVLEFWLSRGVDGFRIDAATSLVEDALLRDDLRDADVGNDRPHLRRVFTSDRPETHEALALMRRTLQRRPDAILIGETHMPLARLMEYYSAELGLHLPMNFELARGPWCKIDLQSAIDQYINLLPKSACANWVLGNHDLSRVATRLGKGMARIAVMMIFTLKGAAFVYNGDELGMTDVDIPVSNQKDTLGLRGGKSRDPQRSPLSWDADGGFTAGIPWLPVGEENRACSVAAQRADANSMLNLYHALIRLRRSEPALREGDYVPSRADSDVLAYGRDASAQRLRVLLNLGAATQVVSMPAAGRLRLSTHLDREGPIDERVELRPYEGVIVEQA